MTSTIQGQCGTNLVMFKRLSKKIDKGSSIPKGKRSMPKGHLKGNQLGMLPVWGEETRNQLGSQRQKVSLQEFPRETVGGHDTFFFRPPGVSVCSTFNGSNGEQDRLKSIISFLYCQLWFGFRPANGKDYFILAKVGFPDPQTREEPIRHYINTPPVVSWRYGKRTGTSCPKNERCSF